MTGEQTITRNLRLHMPDFCYQTAYEITLFLEQLDEDVNEDSVVNTLCLLKRRGCVFARKVVNPDRTHRIQMSPRVEYIRNPEWKARK